ncbi:MAG: DUF512 domain-containing protein [Clostridia bacterium]|nr:DUF512 domain-containing protein [Clostridia bacterium]
MVKITAVEPRSRSEKIGILPNDTLISINGNNINDVLDYRFYLTDTSVQLAIERDGERLTFNIKKGEYDDIGLDFETPLMDKKHTCKNGCIFCFIDQNPEGLRESLYFKDDDSRLSFLHGNYITLTNMTDEDVARIVKMRFSPINVSVHTTNPELRVKMMKNKRSGEVLRYLKDFKDAGLNICAQIVLCHGINDGDELMRSMRDLAEYIPEMQSVAVVPAGMTKFRDKLYPLTDFTPSEAAEVIDMIDKFGSEIKEKTGSRVFFAADEFYLKAGIPIPAADYYEDYPQLENGVGMLRSFADEFSVGCDDIADLVAGLSGTRTVSVATGVASYPMISSLADKIESLSGGRVKIRVHRIINRFFGESITVSGLLTGKDISEQLAGLELGDALLLPRNCLRHGEDVFLCGMTLAELSELLGTEIRICENDGFDFIDAAFGV